MAGARNTLRKFVLKTNDVWPFAQLNRAPYQLALRAVVRNFRPAPEVAAIYLRHGLAGTTWTPGSSDIDLSVCLADGLLVAEEFAFLDIFWRKFRALKRVFPMLGEIEIVNQAALPTFLCWSASSPQLPQWIPLCGDRHDASLCERAPRWRERALRIAFWIYIELLPPCYQCPDAFLRSHDIRRRVQKTLRQLAPILSESQNTRLVRIGQQAGAAQLIAQTLQALETAASQITNALPHDSAHDPCSIELRSGQRLVILPAGLSHRGLTDCIRQAWNGEAPGRQSPILLTPALLLYWMQHYDPFDYQPVLGERSPVSGQPFGRIDRPGYEHVAGYLLDRISNVITFPRSSDLFLPSLAPSSLENEMYRAAAVRLLLRDNWVSAVASETRAACRLSFPGYFSELQRINGQIVEGQLETARRRAFELFQTASRAVMDLLPRAHELAREISAPEAAS